MNTYTVDTASQRYGVSKKTIYRAIKSGKLKAKRADKSPTSPHQISESALDNVYGQRVDTDHREKEKPLPGGPDASQKAPERTETTEEVLGVLRRSLDLLQKQLAEKDKQLERMDKKLDQQQQLTAGLQQQILQLQAPNTVEVGSEEKQKKQTKGRAQKKSKPKTRPASRKKRAPIKRDKHGRFKKESFWDKLFM